MTETTEEALLLAIETRDDLFDSLEEMLTSENRLKVLMAVEEGKTQGDMAEEVGVGRATVSRSIDELKELEMVEETDDGYRKILPVLDHPIIEHFFEEEFLNDA